MSDNEMSRFLRARREALSPAEVGLPGGDRRRTPGLRRSEVAVLADISVEYLTRLEQGRDRNPSPQVLGALADALRLSPDERQFLHFAAKAAAGDSFVACPGVQQPPVNEVRLTVRALLDRLEPTPAVLVNRLGDVMAHTDGYARLAGPVLEAGNLIRYVFADARARDTYPDWDRVADDAVATLRYACAPNDPHLQEFAGELAVTTGAPFSERFRSSAPALTIRNGIERHLHPEVGELRLSYESLLLLDDTRMITFFPADPATERALNRLLARDLRAVTV